MTASKKANHLAAETSPYLRQHMYNPVEWYAWNEEAWNRAQRENKLVLISIGYSACHWCHVMEHQCFENEKLAAIMNEHFINIKVDREERPDIDNIYMDAVQLMTGRGGWPLNCFALPDKRPIYGGTYFPPEHWEQVLLNLADVFKNDPDKVFEYAEKLTNGIAESAERILPDVQADDITTEPQRAVNVWKAYVDNEFGGPLKAPKFPLPCNYVFLLRYGHVYNDPEILSHVEFTLNQMAHGGIYDHVGGGFARYSVDAEWHVPHFEKMLYDNAQLVSLYAEGYGKWKHPLYKKVVDETVAFINREMQSEGGCFYSALDADTNGEEGDFYVWKSNELKEILNADEFETLSHKFGIDTYSLWEHQNNVLRMRGSIPVDEKVLASALKKLFTQREKRTRPGLDTKVLTSWNAMMVTALCKAGVYLNNPAYIAQAERAFEALKKNNFLSGEWIHCRQSESRVVKWMADDACFLAEALVELYQATFNEYYINQALEVYVKAERDFYDEKTGMFYYTAQSSADVLIRRHEIFDNVIPSSNSVWVAVMVKLGTLTGNIKMVKRGQELTQRMAPRCVQSPMACGNWLANQLNILFQKEVAITGERAFEFVKRLKETYQPQVIWAACKSDTTRLALLESRLINGRTLIYVCRHNTCNLPVETVDEAINALNAPR